MHPIFEWLRSQKYIMEHPSRRLNYIEWDKWVNSPEGMLEIIQHPELGHRPPQTLKTTLKEKYKWAKKWD